MPRDTPRRPLWDARSHLIHGVFFAIGEMLGMNKITDFFIALGAVLLVVFVMTFVV